MLGRVVQVRKEHGCYGSDQVFIRQMNGELQVHENQRFYYLPEVFKNRLTELYKDTLIDNPDTPYTIQGKFKKKGFIVKSKIKNGESTPMRDIKTAIYKKLK